MYVRSPIPGWRRFVVVDTGQVIVKWTDRPLIHAMELRHKYGSKVRLEVIR